MKISDYELLIQLAKIGTVRGTAKAILISQPAVSQRLKYIEQYFGEQIFIRTAKRLQLTPSGELILDHARKVVDHELVIINKLAVSREEMRGTLSIACSTVIRQRSLPIVLSTLMKKYPKVTIDLVTGTSSDIKNDYSNYHVSIVRSESIKDLECTLLFEEPLYIFDTEPFTKGEIKQ